MIASDVVKIEAYVPTGEAARYCVGAGLGCQKKYASAVGDIAEP